MKGADNLDLGQGWHIEVLLPNSSRLSRILPGRKNIPDKKNILKKILIRGIVKFKKLKSDQKGIVKCVAGGGVNVVKD